MKELISFEDMLIVVGEAERVEVLDGDDTYFGEPEIEQGKTEYVLKLDRSGGFDSVGFKREDNETVAVSNKRRTIELKNTRGDLVYVHLLKWVPVSIFPAVK
jgi:hypothetical protein